MQDMFNRDFLSSILESVYTVAHWLGEKIIWLVGLVFPRVSESLAEIVDPLGVLAILTIMLLLAQVARKVAWIVVAVGWILILIRVILIILA